MSGEIPQADTSLPLRPETAVARVFGAAFVVIAIL